jgi:hypothetical protein
MGVAEPPHGGWFYHPLTNKKKKFEIGFVPWGWPNEVVQPPHTGQEVAQPPLVFFVFSIFFNSFLKIFFNF